MSLTKIKPKCPFVKPKKELMPSNFIEFCTAKLGVAPNRVIADIERWLHEDEGSGDATLFSAYKKDPKVKFFIVAKSEFILAGLPVMQQVFLQTSGGATQLFSDKIDGMPVKKGDVVLAGEGFASAIFLAERIALNFGSKISGIAKKTHTTLTEIRKHSKTVQLLETRKTTPGMRIYEKYAVRVAGARNHRHSVDTGTLLKENDLRSIGTIEEALENLSQNLPILTKVEIEVSDLREFRAALVNKADVIMLDNFTMADVKTAVAERNRYNPMMKLELSGNLDEKDISEIANCGVDYMSMGALIYKAPWVDLSIQIYLE